MFRILLFQILILFGCSSSYFDEGCENILPAKLEAWIDMMPGGEPSFLFAGILEMELADTCGMNQALAGTFQMIQSSNRIHTATALINIAEIIFDSEKKKYIAQFGVTPKVKMKASVVNSDLPVNIIFDISCGGKNIEVRFENVSIMKVY